MVVHAAYLADATCVRTLLHHSHRVELTFAMVSPDVALSDILVGAYWTVAHTACFGTLLVHEGWVLVALALRCPARAVCFLVNASLLARVACHWAIAHHEFGVVVASTLSCPSRTLELEVLALG
jgi:hypothetical protein